MIDIKTLTFENNIKEITSCDIYYNKNNDAKKPFVLLLHGFRAFNTWGFIPYFATRLAESGLIAGCLEFSLNTLIDKEKQWFDMDKFRKNTFTQMVTEAKMLIDKLEFLFANNNLMNNWNGEIYLLGHSLGGALAIALNDIEPNIKKLVTICSISDIDIYTMNQKEDWEKLGYKEFMDTNTGQNIILDVTFLRDRLNYRGEKMLSAMVSRINIPTYLIHTEADATVSPMSLDLLSASFTNKKLLKTELIPKANHILNCDHPFKETNPALEYIIENVIEFYKNNDKE